MDLFSIKQNTWSLSGRQNILAVKDLLFVL